MTQHNDGIESGAAVSGGAFASTLVVGQVAAAGVAQSVCGVAGSATAVAAEVEAS